MNIMAIGNQPTFNARIKLRAPNIKALASASTGTTACAIGAGSSIAVGASSAAMSAPELLNTMPQEQAQILQDVMTKGRYDAAADSYWPPICATTPTLLTPMSLHFMNHGLKSSDLRNVGLINKLDKESIISRNMSIAATPVAIPSTMIVSGVDNLFAVSDLEAQGVYNQSGLESQKVLGGASILFAPFLGSVLAEKVKELTKEDGSERKLPS